MSTPPSMSGPPGTNPFIAAAQPLLAAAVQLRAQTHMPDPAGLAARLAEGIAAFERRLLEAGVPRDQLIAARYLLCTFLDDAAEATPWGAAGAWTPHALLMRLHQEPWGGERVFLLLSRLAEAPAGRQPLLALFHVCLSLGLQGKYRDQPAGARQLQELRSRLYALLDAGAHDTGAGSRVPAARQAAPPASLELSPHWQPAPVRAAPRINGLPLWSLLAVILAVAFGVYLTLDIALARASDQAFASIRAIRFASAPDAVAGATGVKPAADSQLADLFSDDRRAGRLDVIDAPGRSVVTIASDTLFEPGGARLTAAGTALLERVGHVLGPRAGAVLVSGFTDATAGRNTQFPSAWHLTDAQARAVARALAPGIDPGRLQTEGRGDADGDPPGGTARASRRIEVTWYPDR